MAKDYSKKFICTSLSLFLAYRTWELVQVLTIENKKDFTVLEALLLAFLISLFTTGIFAFLGFAFNTSALLPNGYYKIKHPKQVNLLYKTLGIKYFRFLLLLFFWGKKTNRSNFFNGRKSGISNLLLQTKQAEFGHLLAFISLTIFTIPIFLKGYGLISLSITLINLVGNFYPIVLQRKHRLRIEQIDGQQSHKE